MKRARYRFRDHTTATKFDRRVHEMFGPWINTSFYDDRVVEVNYDPKEGDRSVFDDVAHRFGGDLHGDWPASNTSASVDDLIDEVKEYIRGALDLGNRREAQDLQTQLRRLQQYKARGMKYPPESWNADDRSLADKIIGRLRSGPRKVTELAELLGVSRDEVLVAAKKHPKIIGYNNPFAKKGQEVLSYKASTVRASSNAQRYTFRSEERLDQFIRWAKAAGYQTSKEELDINEDTWSVQVSPVDAGNANHIKDAVQRFNGVAVSAARANWGRGTKDIDVSVSYRKQTAFESELRAKGVQLLHKTPGRNIGYSEGDQYSVRGPVAVIRDLYERYDTSLGLNASTIRCAERAKAPLRQYAWLVRVFPRGGFGMGKAYGFQDEQQARLFAERNKMSSRSGGAMLLRWNESAGKHTIVTEFSASTSDRWSRVVSISHVKRGNTFRVPGGRTVGNEPKQYTARKDARYDKDLMGWEVETDHGVVDHLTKVQIMETSTARASVEDMIEDVYDWTDKDRRSALSKFINGRMTNQDLARVIKNATTLETAIQNIKAYMAKEQTKGQTKTPAASPNRQKAVAKIKNKQPVTLVYGSGAKASIWLSKKDGGWVADYTDGHRAYLGKSTMPPEKVLSIAEAHFGKKYTAKLSTIRCAAPPIVVKQSSDGQWYVHDLAYGQKDGPFPDQQTAERERVAWLRVRSVAASSSGQWVRKTIEFRDSSAKREFIREVRKLGGEYAQVNDHGGGTVVVGYDPSGSHLDEYLSKLARQLGGDPGVSASARRSVRAGRSVGFAPGMQPPTRAQLYQAEEPQLRAWLKEARSVLRRTSGETKTRITPKDLKRLNNNQWLKSFEKLMDLAQMFQIVRGPAKDWEVSASAAGLYIQDVDNWSLSSSRRRSRRSVRASGLASIVGGFLLRWAARKTGTSAGAGYELVPTIRGVPQYESAVRVTAPRFGASTRRRRSVSAGPDEAREAMRKTGLDKYGTSANVISVAEASRYANVPVATVEKWMNNKQLPSFVGGQGERLTRLGYLARFMARLGERATSTRRVTRRASTKRSKRVSGPQAGRKWGAIGAAFDDGTLQYVAPNERSAARFAQEVKRRNMGIAMYDGRRVNVKTDGLNAQRVADVAKSFGMKPIESREASTIRCSSPVGLEELKRVIRLASGTARQMLTVYRQKIERGDRLTPTERTRLNGLVDNVRRSSNRLN